MVSIMRIWEKIYCVIKAPHCNNLNWCHHSTSQFFIGRTWRCGYLAHTFMPLCTRSRTWQNFELVHINGTVQNFGPPARNFGPLRAEFAWREWRKMLGGHVANWAGLSGFSPPENKISRTFFIDCINKHSKVSNAHNSDDCHGVFNDGMLNKGWSLSRSHFDCLGLMHFFHE